MNKTACPVEKPG